MLFLLSDGVDVSFEVSKFLISEVKGLIPLFIGVAIVGYIASSAYNHYGMQGLITYFLIVVWVQLTVLNKSVKGLNK